MHCDSHDNCTLIPTGTAFKTHIYKTCPHITLKRGELMIKSKLLMKKQGHLHSHRLDDTFELTMLGKRQYNNQINRSKGKRYTSKRDLKLLEFNLFCGGQSTCERDCGLIGKCIDCKPIKNSKLRYLHNCRFHISVKILLSNIKMYHVRFVNPEAHGYAWTPPRPSSQSLTECLILLTKTIRI